MTHRYLLLLALPLLAAGCSRNDGPGGGTDREAVRFSAAIETPTRTADDGDTWATGDEVGIFMMQAGEGTAIETNRPYTVSDPATGALAPNGNDMYYPLEGNVDFIAYYPHNDDAAGGTLVLTVDGQTDAGAQNALDVLWARTDGKSKNSGTVAFTFGHVLSKVTLDVTLGAGLESLGNGDIRTVVFGGMPLTASLDLHDGLLTAGAKDDIEAMRATTTNVDATFIALVVPQTSNTHSGRKATFTVNGETYIWDIPSATAFEAGKNYRYPVTVQKTGVTVGTPVIDKWATHNRGNETPLFSPIGSVTFTDGTTGILHGTMTGGGEHRLSVEDPGDKIVYSLKLDKFPDKEYLTGRKADGIIRLNIDPDTGDLLFREPVSNGNKGVAIPIGSYAEFVMIRTATDGLSQIYIQDADIDLLGFDGVEDSELATRDITRREWTPIRNFVGIFDGGGHTLSNLLINLPDTENVGLFAIPSINDNGSTLRRVGIVSGTVNGRRRVGAVCGYNRGGTITECYNGGVTVTGSQGNIGGVCGYNEGQIDKSYNNGTVTGAGGSIGGVCGGNPTIAKVTGCYNTGAVSGAGEGTGGVVGNSTGTIGQSHNTGTVTSTGIGTGGVCGSGGSATVAGVRFGTITKSYNTGEVSTETDHTGGVVGYHGTYGTISECYNTGDVSGGAEYTGGVAGYHSEYAIISFCNNQGDVSGGYFVGGVSGINEGRVERSHNKGTVVGTDQSVGGVVGWNGNVGNRANGVIINCYNEGSVKASMLVGGVCGFNDNPNGTIRACYNAGPVTGTGSADYIGGVVGANDCQVTGCYNTGEISGDAYVGGVAGSNMIRGDEATIETCYNTGGVWGRIVGEVCGRNEVFPGIIYCFFLGGNNGIGRNDADDEWWQTIKFGDGIWPDTTVYQWQLYDSDIHTGEWGRISAEAPFGGWGDGGQHVFPKLWWEL